MSIDSYQARVGVCELSRPVVFGFHGTGGDENQLFELGVRLVPGAGVITPRGDVLEDDACRFFRRTSAGAYDLEDLARATNKMIDFVAAHIKRNPGHPVYAFGYSNGANILAAVLLKRPDLFERVALLHPLVTWEPKRPPGLSATRILVTGGRHDIIAPLREVERFAGWLSEGEVDVSLETHDGGHELRNTELTALQELFST